MLQVPRTQSWTGGWIRLNVVEKVVRWKLKEPTTRPPQPQFVTFLHHEPIPTIDFRKHKQSSILSPNRQTMPRRLKPLWLLYRSTLRTLPLVESFGVDCASPAWYGDWWSVGPMDESCHVQVDPAAPNVIDTTPLFQISYELPLLLPHRKSTENFLESGRQLKLIWFGGTAWRGRMESMENFPHPHPHSPFSPIS